MKRQWMSRTVKNGTSNDELTVSVLIFFFVVFYEQNNVLIQMENKGTCLYLLCWNEMK